MFWAILVRILAGVSSIGLAIGLGCYVRRIYASWKVYGWGALCFVLSQVAHVPFNTIVLNPLLDTSSLTEARGLRLLVASLALGLSAGFFEETTRWIFYRYKFYPREETPLSYELALMFGSGHGGCEAIIVGLLAIISLIGMSYLRTHPHVIDDMPQDQQEVMEKTLTDYWGSPPFMVLLAPVERMIAMAFHLCASVLVWQGLEQNEPFKYWGLAVAAHTALDAVAVFLLVTRGTLAVELFLLLTALPMSLYVLWYYYHHHGTRQNEVLSSQQDGLMLV